MAEDNTQTLTIELPEGFENVEFVSFGKLKKTYENKLSSLVGQRVGIYGVPDPKKLNMIVAKEKRIIDAPTTICKRVAANLRQMREQNPKVTPIVVVDVKRDGTSVYLSDPLHPEPRVKRPRKNKVKPEEKKAA